MTLMVNLSEKNVVTGKRKRRRIDKDAETTMLSDKDIRQMQRHEENGAAKAQSATAGKKRKKPMRTIEGDVYSKVGGTSTGLCGVF